MQKVKLLKTQQNRNHCPGWTPLKSPRMSSPPAKGSVLRGAGAGSQMICLSVPGAQGANQAHLHCGFREKAKPLKLKLG